MQIARVHVRAGVWSDYDWAIRTHTVSDRNRPGFIARWLVRDAKDENLAHVISLWSSKEVADDYHHSELWRSRWQRERSHVVGEMEIAEGEVHLWPQIQAGRPEWVSRW